MVIFHILKLRIPLMGFYIQILGPNLGTQTKDLSMGPNLRIQPCDPIWAPLLLLGPNLLTQPLLPIFGTQPYVTRYSWLN